MLQGSLSGKHVETKADTFLHAEPQIEALKMEVRYCNYTYTCFTFAS